MPQVASLSLAINDMDDSDDEVRYNDDGSICANDDQSLCSPSGPVAPVDSADGGSSDCDDDGAMWRMLYADDAITQAHSWLARRQPELLARGHAHCVKLLERA